MFKYFTKMFSEENINVRNVEQKHFTLKQAREKYISQLENYIQSEREKNELYMV